MDTWTYVCRAGALALACTSLLTACGGGGGGGGTQSGVSSGVVTGFGSVIVNGVRFDTSSADFSIDDSPGAQGDLAVGDVVTIVGSVNSDGRNGRASEVRSNDAVEGPVDSIDLVAGTLVVAGQLVITDADTSFDDNIPGASLAGLAVGDFVEVAGLFDANGDIRATRIERKPAGSAVEVNGVVANLNASVSFDINDLTINYATAFIDDCPGGALANGLRVEAKGTTFAGEALIATKVECKGLDDDDDEADGNYREIEGLVTRFASITDFDVAGRPVTTTASTVYDRGQASDVQLNAKVEVEGTVNEAGVLVARKVSIRRASNIRIAAAVDAVDAAAGTVTVLGITVRIDALTRVEDKSDEGENDESFSVADINVGDFLEIRGAELPAGSGQVLASRLEREDDDEEETEIQGPVTAVAEPDLEIFGVTIATNGGTEFEGPGEDVISAATFFSIVQVGDLVKADGAEVADQVIVADEVEFEFEDD
jgi:Domain of unknown function (DUF5666)